jgi:hypothetical protein
MSDEVRAAALATAKAGELNLPWDSNALTLTRPLFGWRGGWRVSSYYAPENVTTTLYVNVRTGSVTPRNVVYRLREPQNKDWAFFARRLLFGVAGAVSVYLIASRGAELQAPIAVPAAALGGMLTALFSIKLEKIPGVNERRVPK